MYIVGDIEYKQYSTLESLINLFEFYLYKNCN